MWIKVPVAYLLKILATIKSSSISKKFSAVPFLAYFLTFNTNYTVIYLTSTESPPYNNYPKVDKDFPIQFSVASIFYSSIKYSSSPDSKAATYEILYDFTEDE